MKEITITMDEYKELLMIKGRYEELKNNNAPILIEGNPFVDYSYAGTKIMDDMNKGATKTNIRYV